MSGEAIIRGPAVAPGVRCHWCGGDCEVAFCPGHNYLPGRYVRCLSLACHAAGPVRKTRREAVEAYSLALKAEGGGS
ncbi:hypothetical protein [Paludisphaera sp.]|uniref:hypothetical protein n=1 Tax=Paludisphaera sp. TaxID=2017432 RepID=UPI00301B9D52